ncbi:histone H4-like TAF Taf6, SAGA complex subunit [Saxophila tyrrhenica]|uniref:TBP-associated factor 6 n=1 Tax=Saxophila tyrrhenica TaxID=1690608 RepID=A0AAV9P056_9PEZI|nr:histone H4-like TAF Taf6, SAGA complex subunit [Saxophila tyrrhenica]
MSVWNPENVIDVAESIGIASLPRDVVEHLARDVEFRMAQVVEEALKFMRHSKRTTLTTQDISQALRLLEVEPLYGYESTRPLRFGEASIGPGQPLFYVEDEEVDFEKLINAPLPKVPREMSFTAHWLAVEGVQPTIPQNPSQADQRNQELSAKGPGANSTLAAMSGNDNVSVKPLVKHVLSKELQLYFERTCSAIFEENNEEYRAAAFASLQTDPGLHQLVPYFVQFVADKVTHNLSALFVLTQSMMLISSLLENPSLYLAPYIPSLVPSVLTCVLGKRLGSPSQDGATTHFALRDYASSLLANVTRKYGSTSSTLKPRIARSCLKHFLDSHKPLGTHYGAILGLTTVAGAESVRELILPNLRAYSEGVLQDAIKDDGKREQAEHVVDAIMKGVRLLDEKELDQEALGDVVWQRVQEAGMV